MKVFFCLSIFLALILYKASGQQIQLKGTVIETFSQVPLPFVHVTINDSLHLFTDLDGKFEFHGDTEIAKIECKHLLHRPFTSFRVLSDTITIRMNRFEFFSDEIISSPESEKVMNEVLSWSRHNNPDFYTYYTYSTYNKFSLSPGNTDYTSKMMKSISNVLPGKIKELYDNQHLLLIESSSEKEYLDRYHQKETFTATRSSDVSIPSAYFKTAQLKASNIYSDYITINGKEYLGPLTRKSLEQYNFKIIDSAMVDQRKLLLVKFNPKLEKNFDGLRGQLYIDEKNHAIRYYSISPMDDEKMSTTIYQEFQLVDGQNWFPYKSKTESLTYSGIYSVKYTSALSSTIYNIKRNVPLRENRFDEVILELPSEALENSDFDKRNTLSEKDSNTYKYYEELDKNHLIQKMLFLGEQIYYGYLPLGLFEIDLNRLATFNEVEKVRIGFGLHTNKKFSKKLILGFFVGYGIKDEKFKYGLDWAYKIKNLWSAEYRGYISHDLKEAGAPMFMFDRYQYSSESLRRFRIKILDRVTETGHGVYFHPINYLDIGTEVNFSNHQPTYSYSYKSQEVNSYNFIEFREGLRYAFREQYYKIEEKKISLGTSYPILYLQLTQSLGGIMGNYPFQKIDFKIEENIRLLRLGVSKIQFIGGATYGNAPYMKLYNEKGSRKGTYFLIHNSFETMAYNEFLSDRYFSIFYTHSFGRIYYKHPNIQPTISMMHNFGLGWLSNPLEHNLSTIPIKTMEKGYIESGAMVENVVVVSLGGLKTGLGMGFFYRYGPYSSLKGSENLVVKFALNFGI